MAVTYKLIGKEIKEGKFQGRDYRNLMLYATCESMRGVVSDGVACEAIKLKGDVNRDYNSISVGDEFIVRYNRFGQAESVEIV